MKKDEKKMNNWNGLWTTWVYGTSHESRFPSAYPAQMKILGEAICLALSEKEATAERDLQRSSALVKELAMAYPLYQGSLGAQGYVR